MYLPIDFRCELSVLDNQIEAKHFEEIDQPLKSDRRSSGFNLGQPALADGQFGSQISLG
jgi:hypothetical protein